MSGQQQTVPQTGRAAESSLPVEPPLVSVVIPCYRQAHFLPEAIESVLRQSYPSREIIVVDDGSPDETAEVAGRYPGVRCVRQPNRGLAAARNRGLAEARGEFVVFLDADDRLLPDALRIGVEALAAHPECAFVYGRLQPIAPDGSPLPLRPQRTVERDHCAELLREDFIWSPGAVLYRRAVVESVGGFDSRINACADCDLNIRISRNSPVHGHGQLVLEYRRHPENMSRNSGRMLRTALRALRYQRACIRGRPDLERAWASGRRRAVEYFGERLLREVRNHLRARRLGPALAGMFVLLRYAPHLLAQLRPLRPPRRATEA